MMTRCRAKHTALKEKKIVLNGAARVFYDWPNEMDNIKLKKLLSVLLGTPDDGVQKPVVLEVIEVLHVE